MVAYYFPHYASRPVADFQVKAAKKIAKDKYYIGLMAWGRGLAKSTTFTLLVPFWLWIRGELKAMVIIGNNLKAAQKLLSDLQAEFMANERIIHDFKAQYKHGSWEEGAFETENGSFFKALGMGQSVRGLRHRTYRPDYITFDDCDNQVIAKNPARVNEMAKWLIQDVRPVGSERGCRVVGSNNVFAPKTILSTLRYEREGFDYMEVPAEKNGKPTWDYPGVKDYLKEMRYSMGDLAFNAEFNNQPTVQGSVFLQEMIQWDKMPRIDHFEHLVGYWDVAYSDSKTADYNAVKIWGLKDEKFYLIKAFVRQCKMNDAIAFMHHYDASLPKGAKILWYYESQFWNEALEMVYNDVKKHYQKQITFIKADRPKTHKYERILTMLPYYQNGRVVYNEAEKASNDMQTAIAQLLSIEPGYKTHDDSPDADRGAITELEKNIYISNCIPSMWASRKPKTFI
ncbi:phage uncharacterized protein, C-terminal domain protein [Elysia marginata]|uniref:Phage uncharacterized protein, C-terminal domain protein n=1 Tax=Elysia marginata TaxID=1093978 RepID=A0AAV4GWN6_9GAST|nr:phage uncharacterized protein, C-terminal domain protein [Elysia marginata]